MNVRFHKGVTYFRRWGLSVNEGGTPINFAVIWGKGPFFAYLYFSGWRWHT